MISPRRLLVEGKAPAALAPDVRAADERGVRGAVAHEAHAGGQEHDDGVVEGA